MLLDTAIAFEKASLAHPMCQLTGGGVCFECHRSSAFLIARHHFAFEAH